MPTATDRKIRVHTRDGSNDGTGKPYVFLSHRKKDNRFINWIEGDILRAFDCGVWCDRESLGPEEWDKEIERAVRAANLMVLIVTKNTFEDGCYVVDYEIPLAQGVKDIHGNVVPEGQRHPTPILPIIAEPIDAKTEQKMNKILNNANALRADSERYQEDLKRWLEDILITKTDEENIKIAVNKSKAGDKLSIEESYYLGLGYLTGLEGVVEKDEKKGASRIMGAAYSEFSVAQLKLGSMFYYGDGLEQNSEKSAEWWTQSAESGNHDAMYNLGVLYNNGEGVKQDYQKAVEWCTKAAELGNPKAMNNLGILYEYGDVVEQDYEKAIEWYIKSAELGHSKAMYNLGVLYENGEGVEQDYQKAIEWYTKAVELVHSLAMVGLGSLYKHGKGFTQDYQKAIEWYTKADKAGYPFAQEHIEIIQKLINSSNP
ncbi:MAG: toll/interleukin-1 receptor domain-containing protein [Oscillospiraceae bacterium]|jgi:TPR repeat protein|nr:toll/interleukin-1 receptor domain-containing protein [Oscillospiraceae bacterium]